MLQTIQESNLVRRRTSKLSAIAKFPLSTDELGELHDPKSLAAYRKLFGDDEEHFYSKLRTSKTAGITINQDDIKSTDRYIAYGGNRIPERETKSFLQIAWIAFNDRTMILLTIAAIVSFVLGLYETLGQPPEYDAEGNKIPKVDWVEGVAIMVAVLVVVFVGAINDYQKERQFAKLNRKKENREIFIIRNGAEHVVSIHDLLVGDLINLQTGDVVPADSVLVKGTCECDESALTGESDTIKKVSLSVSLDKYKELEKRFPSIDIGTPGLDEKVPDPMLISGSKLLSGLGQAIVVSVGVNSVNGKTRMALKATPELTPLQERLNRLADSISIYGSVIGLLLFIVLFARFLSYLPRGRRYYPLTAAQKGSRFMDVFIIAVTVIVVAVPEGLPLAVTLALAFATTRMTKDGNLVRVLRACETMGSATAICSDKTGTLTQNKMTVVSGKLAGCDFQDTVNSSTTYQPSATVVQKLSPHVKTDILANISLNSTAFENKEENKPKRRETSSHIPKKLAFPWCKKQSNTHEKDEEKNQVNQPSERFIGSKTETALLGLALNSFGMEDLKYLRSNPAALGIATIVQVIPFESSIKWGGMVAKLEDGTFRFYVKGAAEIILKRCSQQVQSDGSTVFISEELYESASEKLRSMTALELRTISLAHKDFKGVSSWPPIGLEDPSNPKIACPDLLIDEELHPIASGEKADIDVTQKGLILDAILGIHDPLRVGVEDSVRKCRRSGVTVRMVTGDNVLTAKAIAKNCSILSEEEYDDPACAMEGPAFRKLSRMQRRQIIPKLRVLARSSPEDKRVLVESLKQMGEVVAVTGDGTNDAPALTLADVGFSMGIAGTEVAREASDIILMTDDFTAILNAIKWGRCVSTSIKKFIQFQLTVNITAVVLTVVSSLASAEGGSVLTAVQLLWVNLIMDTLAALALATDKPDEGILDRKPKGRSTPLISVSTWKMILGQAIFQLVITFILHFAGRRIFFPGRDTITGHDRAQLDAMVFNTFVWLQFFKLFVCRKLDEADGITNWRDRITCNNLNFFQNITRNGYFLVIVVVIALFQVLIMFIGGAAFSVVRQTGPMWATALICGLLSIPVGMLIRICPDSWAVAIFPAKLFKALKYTFGLGFLRNSKKADHETLLQEDEPNQYLLFGSSAFERAKSHVLVHKEHIKNSERWSFNPVKIFRRWRSADYDSWSSDDDNSIIGSLTMVPTLVGGAVGGFSQMSSTRIVEGRQYEMSPTGAIPEYNRKA
ncbi:HFL005Cp [Eremothecium sinecaudum]|uniref:Calcium-transporting ATPase n=1 Tax=Eremothecium sinecaudum TaxID=45286 RepID=A0A0X8HU33_9SACH|nr:HFL005Cp [Eremothecium sinecaudum]AMD21851.1 HFL005Cp [Eremothecium sinecaudum]